MLSMTWKTLDISWVTLVEIRPSFFLCRDEFVFVLLPQDWTNVFVFVVVKIFWSLFSLYSHFSKRMGDWTNGQS